MSATIRNIRHALVYHFGYSEKDIDERIEKFPGVSIGNKQAVKDFYWALLNEAYISIPSLISKEEDFYYLQEVLNNLMSAFLFSEGRISEALNAKKVAMNMRLQKAELLPYKVDVVLNTCQDCNTCKEFDTVQLPFSTSIDILPFNIESCQRANGCAVVLTFQGLRNGEGRLIMK